MNRLDQFPLKKFKSHGWELLNIKFFWQWHRKTWVWSLGWEHPQVEEISWRKACNPLQYSCLVNSMDRGAWQARVHRVTQNRTWLKRQYACTHGQEYMSQSLWQKLWTLALHSVAEKLMSVNVHFLTCSHLISKIKTAIMTDIHWATKMRQMSEKSPNLI